MFGSTPENEPRKIGSFLMWVALASTCVTSGAFLTSFAPNLLAVSMVQKIAGINIGWTEWFMAMLPISAVLFVLTPWLVYVIYPPTQKTSAEAPIWAAKELTALGPMSRREITMAVLAVGALILWIFAGKWINATTVALVVLGLMIPTKVVDWDDILSNKPAWNILFWYGMLMAVADGLNRVGFLGWFCINLSNAFSSFNTVTVIILMVTVFWYASFFFASITALTTALFPPFLMAAMMVPGLPVKVFILLMCGSFGSARHSHSLRRGPGYHLLRQRLHPVQGPLAARDYLLHVLPGGVSGPGHPLHVHVLRLSRGCGGCPSRFARKGPSARRGRIAQAGAHF